MSSVYIKHSKTACKNRHEMHADPATIYRVIHMKRKELALALLFGCLLPLLMFLIGENWHGPVDKPEETTAIETTNTTQPDTTVFE
jgi:hypothetical protein